jgi:four helix bundle protein
MKTVGDLDVFRLAHEFTLNIYEITKGFPKGELFGLVSQMRRPASSVPMNLAEGYYRLNSAEYRQFVGIAKGSCGELKYQLRLAKDLNYISEEIYCEMKSVCTRIMKMLTRLAGSMSSPKHESRTTSHAKSKGEHK